MNRLLVFLMLLILPSTALAADPIQDQPHWSLELKSGKFAPALERWAEYYEKRSIAQYSGTLAYKLVRQVEAGIGVGTMKARGSAYAPLHNAKTGSVVLELLPVQAFVLVRGLVNEDQWIVPYVGGGLTRMYYRERAEDQAKVTGAVNGYHVRGGLQLCLDNLDRSAANNMYLDYGVHHTYFFAEMERTHAVVKSTSAQLGGTAYLFGLLFEY